MNDIETRVVNIISSVFGILESDIQDDASPDTIESWDSLKHINLIVSLEEEFLIEFSDEEIFDMMNYKLIIETIRNHS
jgi:acyl carrier protein